MRILRIDGKFSKVSRKLIVSVSLIVLGFFLLGIRERFTRSLEEMRKEYVIDRDLASKKTDRLNTYRQVLDARPLPQETKLDKAEWGQIVRENIEAHQIGLKEMRPLQPAAGERQAIAVIAESSFLPLFRFLYAMAEAKEGTYMKRLLLSPVTEDGQLLELQMMIVLPERASAHA